MTHIQITPLRTERGWEIAYDGCLAAEVESIVYATRALCIRAIRREQESWLQLTSSEARYQAQYAYAAGDLE